MKRLLLTSAAAVAAISAMADATAVWTGGGDRMNANDPDNWSITGGANTVPDADTRIVIDGATDFNCPLGQSLVYKEIVFGDVKLTADCDWRGLTVATNYIDVSAGAYIDTGFKPNQNTRVVMDVTVMDSSKCEYWFGAWNTNYKSGAFAVGNDESCLYLGFGNSGGNGGPVIPNGRHTIDFDKGVLKVDGTTQTDWSGQTVTVNHNLYLFVENRRGSPTPGPSQVLIRCHSCQIYDNGTRVRSYVPAFNGTDFGFYEEESGAFVGKSGSGAFSGVLASPAIDGNVDLNGHSLKLADTVGEGTITDTSGYIDAPKDTYVNTGFAPNQNTRVVMEATVNGPHETWFGVSDDGSGYWYCKKVFGAANDSKYVYRGYGNSYTGDGAVVSNGRHTLEFSNGVFKVDGTAYSGLTTPDFQLANGMYIFAHNRNGAAINTKTTVPTVHACRIYNGETLAKDFVPAYNGTEYGFYERLGGTFVGKTGAGTLTGSIPASELHIDIIAGRTVENSTLTLSGTLKLVKDGAGTFVGSKASQGYTGGTVVSNGVAKSGVAVGAWGMAKSTITVADGAAFDWAGKQSSAGTAYGFSIEGDGPDGAGALVNTIAAWGGTWYSQNMISALELNGDATVGGYPVMGFIPPSTLALGNNTLTIRFNNSTAGANNQIFSFRGVTALDGGTIVFENASTVKATFPSFYNGGSDLSDVTFVLGPTAALNVEEVTKLASFVDCRTNINYLSGATHANLNVLESYKPMGTNLLWNIAFGDSTHLSPVLDLSALDGPFVLSSENNFSMSAAEGASVRVVLGERKVGGSPIMTWAGEKPAWVDSLRFVRGDDGRRYRVVVKDDGIYIGNGLMLIVR